MSDNLRTRGYDDGCRCWNEGQWGRVHREDCPIHGPKPEPLAFVNEEEQARVDALPDDFREPVKDLMRKMHSVRPDLNQPGMFGDWLTTIEKYAKDASHA